MPSRASVYSNGRRSSAAVQRASNGPSFVRKRTSWLSKRPPAILNVPRTSRTCSGATAIASMRISPRAVSPASGPLADGVRSSSRSRTVRPRTVMGSCFGARSSSVPSSRAISSMRSARERPAAALAGVGLGCRRAAGGFDQPDVRTIEAHARHRELAGEEGKYAMLEDETVERRLVAAAGDRSRGADVAQREAAQQREPKLRGLDAGARAPRPPVRAAPSRAVGSRSPRRPGPEADRAQHAAREQASELALHRPESGATRARRHKPRAEAGRPGSCV